LFALTIIIGFPLPFTFITVSPGWVTSMLIPLLPFLAKAWLDPEARLQIINTLKSWISQEILVVIYPAYFYIFTTLPANAKTPFAMLLPIMKIFMRNVTSRTVIHLGDEIPEVVLMNVEVFNSLFMSYCMQNSPSIWTTLGLIVIDGTQMIASMHDVDKVIKRMQIVKDQVTKERARRIADNPTIEQILELRRKTILGYAQDILERDSSTQTAQVVPKANDATNVTKLELDYALNVRKVLYITEFVILLNFVEVIVPIIFSANLVVMYHLPNRNYYSQIKGMDDDKLRKTLENVMLYCFLQILSLVVLFYVLWHRLRISGLRELAFVLERQGEQVQTKLVFWVFYNVQATMQHYGEWRRQWC
ncbi:hypothetical protein PHYSODRAFT_489854, partial [Phytophthora sojae]